MATGEMRALTGLRGVAAVWVMAFHLTNGGRDGGWLVGPLLGHAYLGVDLFFVLSGYVIAHSYGADFAGGVRAPAMAGFLARRAARIYPLYAVTLCVALVEAWLGILPAATPMQAVANALLVQQWGLADSVNLPSWSISVECLAYLVFPFLAAVLAGRGQSRAVLAAAAAGGMAVLVSLMSAPVPATHSAWPALRCLTEFALGACAWWAVAGRMPAGGWRFGTPLALCLAACGTVLPCAPLFVVLAPVALVALSDGRGLVARTLSSGPLHRLGTISYSIYLLHWLLMPMFALWPSHQRLTALVIAALTLALAEVTYRIVEVPGRSGLSGFLTLRARTAPAQGLA